MWVAQALGLGHPAGSDKRRSCAAGGSEPQVHARLSGGPIKLRRQSSNAKADKMASENGRDTGEGLNPRRKFARLMLSARFHTRLFDLPPRRWPPSSRRENPIRANVRGRLRRLSNRRRALRRGRRSQAGGGIREEGSGVLIPSIYPAALQGAGAGAGPTGRPPRSHAPAPAASRPRRGEREELGRSVAREAVIGRRRVQMGKEAVVWGEGPSG